jgi:hypothetical protein
MCCPSRFYLNGRVNNKEFVYSFVTYAIAQSGGVVSMVAYVLVAVLTALTSEAPQAEVAPVAAPVEELALEEAVVLPAVPAENPGVCT